jgi:hypothetical protein
MKLKIPLSPSFNSMWWAPCMDTPKPKPLLASPYAPTVQAPTTAPTPPSPPPHHPLNQILMRIQALHHTMRWPRHPHPNAAGSADASTCRPSTPSSEVHPRVGLGARAHNEAPLSSPNGHASPVRIRWRSMPPYLYAADSSEHLRFPSCSSPSPTCSPSIATRPWLQCRCGALAATHCGSRSRWAGWPYRPTWLSLGLVYRWWWWSM